MTDTSYAAIAGALLSLAFFYVPGMKDWYEKLDSYRKQWVMIGLLFVVVAGAFGLSCAGRVNQFTCDVGGGFDAIETFIWAIVANSGVYKGINYIAERNKKK